MLFSISACSHQHSNVSVITVQWDQSRSSTVFTVCLLLISGAELPLGLTLHVWLQERTKTPPAVCWVKVFPVQMKTEGQEHILSSLTHQCHFPWQQSYHDLPEAPCHKHRREYNLEQTSENQKKKGFFKLITAEAINKTIVSISYSNSAMIVIGWISVDT